MTDANPYRRLREHLQLRPIQFARALGIGRARVWQLENTRSALGPAKIEEILETWPEACAELGLERWDFLRADEPVEHPST